MKKFVKKPVIFVTIMLLFLVVLLQSAYSQENAVICVSSKNIKTLPSGNYFVGVNWRDEGFDGRYMYQQESLEKLAETLQKINVNSIRFPSGVNVRNFFWDVSMQDVIDSLDKNFHNKHRSPIAADKMDLYKFLDFCKKNKFKATIQFNTQKYYDKNTKNIYYIKDYKLDSNSVKTAGTAVINEARLNAAADYAAAEVKWINDNGYADIVQYWELGNEDYMEQNDGTGFSGKEYAHLAAVFINKVKKADPNAKIIITNYITPDKIIPNDSDFFYKWHYDLFHSNELQKVKDKIYAITTHLYTFPFSDAQNLPESYRASVYSNYRLDINGFFKEHMSLLSQYGYKNLKVDFNEFNASNFNSRYAHSWLGALGNAKLIMSSVNFPACEHADIHNLEGFYGGNDIFSSKSFGIVHYASRYENPFLIYPVANVIQILNENVNGSILESNSNTTDVYTTVAKNGKNLNVIVLNFKKDRNIKIQLGQLPYKTVYAENKSLGKDVQEMFSIISEGDSSSDPSEVRQLNIINNAITVTESGTNSYSATIPKNTLAVLKFKLN